MSRLTELRRDAGQSQVSDSAHHGGMPPTQRRSVRGRIHGRRLLAKLGEELRTARFVAGLSQAEVGRAVGVSGSTVSRVERALLPEVSLVLLATLFAVLGQNLSARPYPDGPPIRDVAHARLIARFRARLPGMIALRTEVPIRIKDLRAWDGELRLGADSVRLEAETVLHDIQALDRRVALKMADDGADTVLLIVADTKRNRRILREFRELLRGRYPLDQPCLSGWGETRLAAHLHSRGEKGSA